MRQLPLALLIIIVIFLSGCIGQPTTPTLSKTGLSSALTSDTTQAKTSMPVTFILTIKNSASENATSISAELLNLTDWRVENQLQNLDQLFAGDSYKFSWVAYAPSTPKKNVMPIANLFYSMKTKTNLTIRVYDNNYLNTLKPEDKAKVIEKPALLSSVSSRSTPVSATTSLKQPFILTGYTSDFPFVIEIKNVGSGEPFTDDSTYFPYDYRKNYVRFDYESTSTINCDYGSGDFIGLVNKSKSIVCRLIVSPEQVNKYADFVVHFTISYTYLDRASMKLEVK